MNKHQQAQEQNLKVWARRMGLELNDEHYLNLARLMPGSVLVGPLAMVMSNRLRGEINDPSKRFKTAQLLARGMAKHLRGETAQTNILAILAEEVSDEVDSVLFASHSPTLVKLFSEGVTSRGSEKARPNLHNILRENMRKDNW